MPDIAASDVTYSLIDQAHEGGSSNKSNVIDATFGDGALTYPSGGVPLLKGKMGLPTQIKSLSIMDEAADNGLIYKYDSGAETLRIYEVDTTGDTDKELAELDAGADTPAAATLRLHARGW